MRWFKLTIPEARLRKMKRAEYYAVRSYLRKVERQIAEYLRKRGVDA